MFLLARRHHRSEKWLPRTEITTVGPASREKSLLCRLTMAYRLHEQTQALPTMVALIYDKKLGTSNNYYEIPYKGRQKDGILGGQYTTIGSSKMGTAPDADTVNPVANRVKIKISANLYCSKALSKMPHQHGCWGQKEANRQRQSSHHRKKG